MGSITEDAKDIPVKHTKPYAVLQGCYNILMFMVAKGKLSLSFAEGGVYTLEQGDASYSSDDLCGAIEGLYLKRVNLYKPSEAYQDLQKAEYEKLEAKYKEVLKFYDEHVGTPCEQIRHTQEIDTLAKVGVTLRRQDTGVYAVIINGVNVLEGEYKEDHDDLDDYEYYAEIDLRKLEKKT